jgi:aldose 1-epimerase
MIEIANERLSLGIDPARGGGITYFRCGEIRIFRDAVCGSNDPLDLSSFVLVPYSNRIAQGRFCFEGMDVALPPNHLPASRRHPVHGDGWLGTWQVESRDAHMATLRYHHQAHEWPWEYEATQTLTLDGLMLRHQLSVTNMSDRNMPVGTGFHPYFPRSGACIQAQFDGHWNVGEDGLPVDWNADINTPKIMPDTHIDTLFTGRQGGISLRWPGHSVLIHPAQNLPETHIFIPRGMDYFCVEPVSHMTDAINRDGLHVLEPAGRMEVATDYIISLH